MITETALITSSNKGISFKVTIRLGSKGIHIFLSGRNEEKVRDTETEKAKYVPFYHLNNMEPVMFFPVESNLKKYRF